MSAVKRKKLYRFVSFLLVVVTCMGMFFPTSVYATNSSGSGNDEVETVGDIYDVSTALTAYVNNVVGANSNDKHNNQRVENPGNVGNAGAYVGYGDSKQKFQGFITNNSTVGSSTSTYDAWKGVLKGSDAKKNYTYDYVRFGRLLADAGLDETFDSSASQTKRMAVGFLSRVFYGASEIVPSAFGIALNFLSALNPFSFFKVSHVPVGGITGGNSGINYNSSKVGTILQPLQTFLSNIYDSITKNLTWTVVVPMFLMFSLFSIAMLRRKASTTLGKLAIRVVFIVVGIPILGGLYTQTLLDLGEVTKEEPTGARLVASSYVDFSHWADKNLYVDGHTWTLVSTTKDTDAGGMATSETLRSLRTTVGNINGYSNSAFTNVRHLNGKTDALSGGQWDSNGKVEKKKQSENETLQDGIDDLLGRYQDADSYTAPAYASKVSKSLEDTNHGDASMLNNMFDTTDEMADWLKRTESDNEAIWNGTNASDDAGMDWLKYGKNGANKSNNIFNDGNMRSIPNGKEMKYSGKLSTMSMYNYLSTSFGSKSIVTYSNSTSISEHTTRVHASVTSVGSGALKILFIANMWVCLAVTALLGIMFAFMTVFDSLKTSIKLLVAIPASALGALRAISQVVIYTITMIFQVIIGAFMYAFVSDFVLVFATLVENLVSSGGGSTIGSGKDLTDMTILIGGRFMTWMQNAFPSSVWDSNVSIYLMVGFEIALVVLFASSLIKYRRAIARVYSVSMEKFMSFVTFAEFQDELHRIWHGGKVGIPSWNTDGVKEVFAFLAPDNNTVLVRG